MPGTQRGSSPSERWRAAPSLTIWVYDSPLGGAAGEVRFKELVRRGAVVVIEAVAVTWVRGSHRPHVGHLRRRSPAPGTSVLCSLVSLLADSGPDGGHRISALASRLTGTGIDHQLLADARRAFAPGTSALLVLASDVNLDVVRPIVEHGRARRGVVMVHADLTTHAVEMLRGELLPHIGEM
ncbi:hypothetical protein GUY44_04950 [Pimelobacter simplex]|uniref:DUF1269 domain-containing protein n=1 Tax=Nocardioides simplex TaxID=2045 RepID=UPI000535BFC5|nr:DUF1269 domain-containing protein [Pimelobacter simplex]MCG8149817.1 hypothetical protein [Pimelobacter simplex]GEB13974.1 hypothetical protein NSI01_22890 [Pimelobacter simplex]SFM65693.1 Uncharacterized membrane protein [Pimelobacter simplex]